jgi:hypothetical protein
MKIFALVAGLVLSPTVALAQSFDRLPANVQAAIAENVRSCDGKTTFKDGFVSEKDVNDDGVTDYVLDYGNFVCDGNEGYFCGTGGCLTQVFASLRRGGYAKVLDENVRALTFRRAKGRPAMVLDLHGNACGKVGAAPCPKTLLWNGAKFVPAR